MTNKEFISKATNWIKNKIILSKHSNWYKIPYRMASLNVIVTAFQHHLNKTYLFNHVQIANLLIKHKDVLYNLLPVHYNSSYGNSSKALDELLEQAQVILSNTNKHE